MRVSAKAEYACLAMLELAANYLEPQPRRLKTIADAHGIPQRFLVQILLQLKSSGLVASVRGASGGYQLARTPERISLGDIVHAIDRPTTARGAGGATHLSPAQQALHSLWREIDLEEHRLLEECTLADLVRKTREKSSLSYQI